jgi:O-antigen/teichoic acid export membrane protein
MNKSHQNFNRILSISALSSSTARSIQLISTVVTVPIIFNDFGGASGYGVWVTITAALSFIGLADLGIANGLARLIARSQGKRQAIGKLLKTMLFVEVIAAFVVLLLTFVLANFLPYKLGFSSENDYLVRQAIFIMGIATALSMPLRLGIPILTGHQYYGLHLIGDTFANILSLLCIIGISYWSSLDFSALASVRGVAIVLGSLTGFLLARMVSGPWYLNKYKIDKKLIRIGLNLGLTSLLITASFAISLHGTTLGLGIYGKSEWAGIWALAITVVTQVHYFGSSLTAPITTLVAQLEAKRNTKLIKKTLFKVSLILVAIVSVLMVAATVFGSAFVGYFLPTLDKSGQTSGLINVLTILLMASVLTLPFNTVTSFLLGTRKHWAVARWSLVSSIASIVTLFATIPVLQIWGAVLSRWVFVLIPAIVLYIPVMREILGNKIKYFLVTFISILLWPVFSGWIVWILGLTNNALNIDLFLGIIIYFLLSLSALVIFIPDFRSKSLRSTRFKKLRNAVSNLGKFND